jgi:hypothetical protein
VIVRRVDEFGEEEEDTGGGEPRIQQNTEAEIIHEHFILMKRQRGKIL